MHQMMIGKEAVSFVVHPIAGFDAVKKLFNKADDQYQNAFGKQYNMNARKHDAGFFEILPLRIQEKALEFLQRK